MDPEFADLFAQQAAVLGNYDGTVVGEHVINDDNEAQEASEQADFNKWMAEEFGDTDGQELQHQGDLDGGAMAHAAGGGGYSPSAVPYDHQQRGYSPSAPIIPEQGYSPSNPVIPLAQGDEDGSEMQQSRSGSQEPAPSQAQQPPQHTASVNLQNLQSEQVDPGAVPGVSQYSTSAHHVPGGPSSSLSFVESQSSTPIPVPTSPQLPQLVTSSNQPLTPMQDAQARIAKNIHDHDAWKDYLSFAENTADLDTVRDAYEEALKAFPNTASLQIAYLNHFLTPPLFQRAEALFARFLRPSPSVELWKFYLTYVRRINTNTSDPIIRDIVRKAYEFALAHVGHDMDSGQIWRDYIDFLKNTLDSRTTWDAQQKMDALRSAYHRAVVIPLDNVEALWRELDQYENGLNKITAKKFLQDLSPGYMTAKTALRDLKRLLGPISTPTLSTAVSPSAFSLPPYPTWSNEDRVLAGHWKAYLKWEEGNPLVLEDQAALHNRIISAYRKAVARMRFFPDITWLAYHTFSSLGKTEEAVATLKQGILSNPSSPVLSFAYAELMETQKNIKEVNDTYNTLIETMHKNLEDLQTEIEEEVAAARAAVLHGEVNEQDPTTPAVIEAEDRARKTRERRSKDMEAARNELGVVWVMLMRFSRRSEGLRPARAVFARARKDKWCPWVVYEAAALMEYHCTKAADVATKIFEIGLKQFADNIDYVVRYLNFLISINDDNNARALFERTISTFPGEKGRPLWERWSRYEFNFSDLAASQKLEQRMAEALPSSATNPPIKQFAHKYTYLGIDAIASRDLGAGGRGSTTVASGKTTEGPPLTPSTTMGPTAGIPSNGNVANKRAASPARRRDPSPPPNKRFKGNSPPPLGGRGRDWESGRDRERGKRNFTPPRRDYRRDADAVPEGVVWFMSTLPSAASFDGQLEKSIAEYLSGHADNTDTRRLGQVRSLEPMTLCNSSGRQICPLLMPAQEIHDAVAPHRREVDALRRITGRIKDPVVVGADTAPNTSPRLIPPPLLTTFTTFGLKSTDTLAPPVVTTTHNDKMAVDMLSGLLLEDAIVHNAIHKAQNTPDKTFFLGMLAGLWITFGGLAGLSAAGGIPVDVRNNWPILPKLGLAFFFPTALHFIVLFGGELFTGNTMIVLIGWLNKKLTLKKMLLNWFIVYIGNFCGCVLFAYLFGYLTQVFEHEPYLSYVQSIAVAKTHYGWGVIFLKGIVANTCVCLGVILGLASRDAAGKIIALWFPPVIFVLMGMEHVVANQFFVNIGLMYGAETTIGKMWFNQSAAALGNLVGGAIVLGLSEHVMNHWKSPLPWHKDHPRGSLAAHDIESTRKAKEAPSQNSSSANSIMGMFTGHHNPKIEVTPDLEQDNITLRPPNPSHHFNGTPQMV